MTEITTVRLSVIDDCERGSGAQAIHLSEYEGMRKCAISHYACTLVWEHEGVRLGV